MASSFVDFINSLPDDKLMALAKPIGSDRARATIVQVVLDKFGVLGWQKLLERLDTTTLQAIGNEVAVEHDDRASLLKTIPKMVSATTHETLASFSTSLVDIMWENLGIIGKPELEILVDELFIGGIESIVGIWTITQMNEIIDTYHISSRNLKLKDEIVFDIVKAILDNSYSAPEMLASSKTEIPPTPRSPIRPADDRPRRRTNVGQRGGKVIPMEEDKENAHENDLSSAVAKLKFEPVVRSRRGRAQQNM